MSFQKELVLFKKDIQTFGLFFSKMVKRTANQISTSTESALPDPNLKKGRGTETTWGQKAAIMEWLELPPGDNFRLITGAYNLNLIVVMDNFRLIIGAATSKMNGVVAGAKVSKQSAYVSLAVFVNQRCGRKWDSKTTLNRYRAGDYNNSTEISP